MSESSAQNPSWTEEQIAKITESVAAALRKGGSREGCCTPAGSGAEEACCVSVGGSGAPRVVCICIDSKSEPK